MTVAPAIDSSEVRIDTYNPAIPNPTYHMRITHLPTGHYVQGEGKGYGSLRRSLMAELEAVIAASNSAQD